MIHGSVAEAEAVLEELIAGEYADDDEEEEMVEEYTEYIADASTAQSVARTRISLAQQALQDAYDILYPEQ